MFVLRKTENSEAAWFLNVSFPSHAADGKKHNFFPRFFGTRRFGWFQKSMWHIHGFMASCVFQGQQSNWLMANPIATLGSLARSKKNNNQKVADRPRNPWYQTLTAFHICKLHFSLSMSCASYRKWHLKFLELGKINKNLIYSLRQVCWSLPNAKGDLLLSICAVSTPKNLDTSVGFYHMFACTKWSTLS